MDQNDVKAFLDSFRPERNPSAQPLEKAKFWLDIYQHTENHYPDADEFQLRIRRRNARQNLRRLLEKHPFLLSALKAQAAAEVRP